MIAAPAPLPPAISQPAPYQVSFGMVRGLAAPGTSRIVVSVHGRTLGSRTIHRRRFSLQVALPIGDVAVRVTTIGRGGHRAARVVRHVFGLPAAARPRAIPAWRDRALSARIQALARRYRGTAGVYVQSLTGGAGAAWNARARFPAASTLKLAIATTVLAKFDGLPARGSPVDVLLREAIVRSDNAAANALEVWLAGSTSAGGYEVDRLMRSLGLVDSLMYGGYETSRYPGARAPIPVRVEEQPNFGVGKYTTASDLAGLERAIWLAAGGRGRLHAARPSFTAADGRYLLWLLAHVQDTRKLDGIVGGLRGVAVLHKAGWVASARHDAGLVFWSGGVFVISVMTWNPRGAGRSSDLLAARCAAVALERFHRRSR